MPPTRVKSPLNRRRFAGADVAPVGAPWRYPFGRFLKPLDRLRTTSHQRCCSHEVFRVQPRPVSSWRQPVVAGVARRGPGPVFTGKAGAITVTLTVPEGVTKVRGVLAFTATGLGSGWGTNADVHGSGQAPERGRGARWSGANEFGDASYPTRCQKGEFKWLLDALAAAAKAANHPEVAYAPIVGSGHSHGGDYWNYFNACYPERMALVFCKASGGVQYSEGLAAHADDLGDRHQRSQGQPRRLPRRHDGPPGGGHRHVAGAGPGRDPRRLHRRLAHDGHRSDGGHLQPARARRGRRRRGADHPLRHRREVGQVPAGRQLHQGVRALRHLRRTRIALSKTSFLPNEEVAKKWKAYGAQMPAGIVVEKGGRCTTCYKTPSDEPEAKPLNAGPGPGTPAPMPSTDAGTPTPPPGTGGQGGAARPRSRPQRARCLDAAARAGWPSPRATTPPKTEPPKPDPPPSPAHADSDGSSGVAGGCTVAPTRRPPARLPLGLLLLALALRRRR